MPNEPKRRAAGFGVTTTSEGKISIIIRTVSHDEPRDFTFSIGDFDSHEEAADYLQNQADARGLG